MAFNLVFLLTINFKCRSCFHFHGYTFHICRNRVTDDPADAFWSVTCQVALCESHDGMMWFPKRHGLGWRLWKIAEIWSLTNPLWKLQKSSLEQSRRQANRKQNRWGCMFLKPFTTVFNELELEHREEMSRNLEHLLQGDDNFYLPQSEHCTSPLVHVSDPTGHTDNMTTSMNVNEAWKHMEQWNLWRCESLLPWLEHMRRTECSTKCRFVNAQVI